MLVRLDRLEPDRLEVVDRGAEPDRLGHRRRCPPRTSPAARPRSSRSSPTLRIMWPPSRNGSIASSSSARPQRKPIPLGPQHLVAGDGDEVGAERLHVEPHGAVRPAPRRSTRIAPRSCAHAASRVRVVDRAERVRDDVRRRRPSRCSKRSSSSSASSPLSSTGMIAELGARAVRDVLPGHEVRVVLELGREHDVARAEVRAGPRRTRRG